MFDCGQRRSATADSSTIWLHRPHRAVENYSRPDLTVTRSPNKRYSVTDVGDSREFNLLKGRVDDDRT